MDPLTLSVVGGALGTLVFAVARYFAKRRYLVAALTEDMQRSREGIAEIRAYIGEFFATAVSEGEPITIAARFERSDTSVTNALIAQLAHYAPELLRKMISFQEQMRKVEVLFANFMTEITLLKNAEKPLVAEDINYLVAKAARIVAAADLLLGVDADSIDHLPSQYPDPISPVNMHDAILRIYDGEQVPRRMVIYVLGGRAAQRIDAHKSRGEATPVTGVPPALPPAPSSESESDGGSRED